MASAHGLTCNDVRIDDDSVDFMLRRRGMRSSANVSSPQLEVQLKSTTAPDWKQNELIYDLDVTTYNRMCDADRHCPMALFVVVLPTNRADWATEAPDSLTLQHSAYWLHVGAAPKSLNASTKRVKIPRTQRVTPAAMHDLLDRVDWSPFLEPPP